MSSMASTFDRLHNEFIRILFLQDHQETDRFFFKFQELCLRNQIVDFSTTSARLFLLSSYLGLEISLPRLQTNVLTSILMDRVSHSPFTLANFSSFNLVFVFRYSSSTTNPVSERSVDSSFLVSSLSSHRYQYISLLFNPRFIDS